MVKPKKKRVFKDEVKDTSKKEADRDAAIATVEAVLETFINRPDSWQGEGLTNIKSMVCQIGSDRLTYPPPLGDNTSTTPTPQHTKVNLTPGLASSLYKREDIDYSNITIKITVASPPEMVSTKIDGLIGNKNNNTNISYRRWKLNAVDGDNNVITLRLDSTLNSEGKLLTPGAVIKVKSAFPIYMNYGDLYDMRCAIVLRDFAIITRQGVPTDSKGPPERLKVAKSTPSQSTSANAVDKSSTNKNGCICHGNICSKHDIEFVVCLTKCIPLDSISLERIARECVFVDRELKDMENRHKRFLYYYYYATSVYQFHGRGNRVELPECLVSVIRSAYPDEE